MTIYDERNMEHLQQRLAELATTDIEIDIGCGQSELCHALSQVDSEGVYIAVDWNRHWCIKGEHRRRKLRRDNVMFVNMEAETFLRTFVKSASARVVYVLFPSPGPRAQRLVTESFVWEVYRILGPRGELRLITDDDSES